MSKAKAIQQGDIRIRPRPPITRHMQRVSSPVVVARGEKTGHQHVLTAPAEVEVYERGGVFYAIVPEGSEATIQHDEHAPVTIAPGTWEIDKVREFDYVARQPRNVSD